MMCATEVATPTDDTSRSYFDILDGHPRADRGAHISPYAFVDRPIQSHMLEDCIHDSLPTSYYKIDRSGRFPMERPNPNNISIDDVYARQVYHAQHLADATTEAASVDRGANVTKVGRSMVNIGWKDKYIDLVGVGGMVCRNLRIGDFKTVMVLRDPLDGHRRREAMCIFRNCASSEDPKIRDKMHTVLSVIQMEDRGLIVEDNFKSDRRIHHLETGEYTDLMFINGIPRVFLRRPTIEDEDLPVIEMTEDLWSPSDYDDSPSDEAWAAAVENRIQEGDSHPQEEDDRGAMDQDDMPFPCDGDSNDEDMEDTSSDEDMRDISKDTPSSGTSGEDSIFKNNILSSVWQPSWDTETTKHIFVGEIERVGRQARREMDLVYQEFGHDYSVPFGDVAWFRYMLGPAGKFINTVRYLERFHKNQIMSRYREKDSKYKQKLRVRVRIMASIHDIVAHHTRVYHEPWNKPPDLPYDKSGHDHNDYTVVMHPWLIDYLMAYRLDARDVVEGMLYGSRDRYMLAVQNQLRGCKPILPRLTPVDYAITSLDQTWKFETSPSEESADNTEGSISLTDSYGN